MWPASPRPTTTRPRSRERRRGGGRRGLRRGARPSTRKGGPSRQLLGSVRRTRHRSRVHGRVEPGKLQGIADPLVARGELRHRCSDDRLSGGLHRPQAARRRNAEVKQVLFQDQGERLNHLRMRRTARVEKAERFDRCTAHLGLPAGRTLQEQPHDPGVVRCDASHTQARAATRRVSGKSLAIRRENCRPQGDRGWRVQRTRRGNSSGHRSGFRALRPAVR